MPKFNKKTFGSEIIGFKLAELHKNKEWLIVYYSLNPKTNKLERFRNRVPKMGNTKERIKYAKSMINIINEKLLGGWSPFFEKNSQVKTIDFCFDYFYKIIDKELEQGIKRITTIRSYRFTLKNLQAYLKNTYSSLKFIDQIDTIVVSSFLDNEYIGKNVSARMYNLNLSICKVFLNFCLSKGFISKNPIQFIKRKKTEQKGRIILNKEEMQKIYNLKNTDFPFYIYTMLIYYCFIRPKELLLLKVKDVDIDNSIITIESNISKNKKTQNVTIPLVFLEDLKRYIENANKDYYLFSANRDFSIGNKKRLSSSNKWFQFKKNNKIREKVDLYSLKDTGITDLLKLGVPAIKVKDQARHSSLSITEMYITRNDEADDIIKNLKYDV